MKILLDENVIYLKSDLLTLGYDVITPIDLRRAGWKYKGDYQLLKYAEQNGLLVISKDKEVIDNCTESNIPCLGIIGIPYLDEIVNLDKALKWFDQKKT